MGVDSMSILTRWVHEPETRDFDLDQLVIVTAMTGDEHDDTEQVMTDHALPMMRSHHLRYVQLCRAGQAKKTGHVVLDDSRQPTQMHMRGPWSLSTELAATGTVPQVARRACSQRAKGDVVDGWLHHALPGVPFRHIKGYRASEGTRIAADIAPVMPGRHRAYPLADWGWDRGEAERYLETIHGQAWPRSCCRYCPFQASKVGVVSLVDRWARHPSGVLQSLLLERVALALNPRAGQLFNTTSAHDVVRAHPQLHDAAQVAEMEMARLPWALYDVRRVFPARGDNPTAKGQAWRSVRRLATGSPDSVHAELLQRAARYGATLTTDAHGITRAWLRTARATYPAVEHHLATAPALAHDKERPRFPHTWQEAIAAIDQAASH